LWVISNRNEIICLDTEGFRDGENDGPVKNEPNQQSIDADIVWSVDMIQQYGAVPLRKAYGDPVIHGDLLIVPTSNGVDDKTHTKAADAPSLIALNKTNGQLSWSMKPKYPIFQGSYSSPTIATVAGEKLLLFPAGDGWLYALNPENGKPIWWFDLNHKNVSTDRYGNYERLYGSHAPVVKDGKVLVALGLGDDGFEHTESRMWCIDASGRGDVSSEIGPVGKPGQPNPNSAAIWEFTGGYGEDSSPAPFFATLNAPKIVGSQVFVATATGFVHCIELQSGKERWHFDLLSSVYAPLVILADQLLVFDEDHKVTILPTDGTNPNEIKPHEIVFPEPVYSGVSPNQSRLYLSSDKSLYQMNPSTLIDEATIQSP
jgi:outer membrane protein assembly factor BamB